MREVGGKVRARPSAPTRHAVGEGMPAPLGCDWGSPRSTRSMNAADARSALLAQVELRVELLAPRGFGPPSHAASSPQPDQQPGSQQGAADRESAGAHGPRVDAGATARHPRRCRSGHRSACMATVVAARRTSGPVELARSWGCDLCRCWSATRIPGPSASAGSRRIQPG